MKPRARKFLDVFSLGVFPLYRAVKKIVENRQAVKAGKPKPHDPAEIAGDIFDSAMDAGKAIKDRRK